MSSGGKTGEKSSLEWGEVEAGLYVVSIARGRDRGTERLS